MEAEQIVRMMNARRHEVYHELARVDTDKEGWFPAKVFREIVAFHHLKRAIIDDWAALGLIQFVGRGAYVRCRVSFRGPVFDGERVFLVRESTDVVRRVAIPHRSVSSANTIIVGWGREDIEVMDWRIEYQKAGRPQLVLLTESGTAYYNIYCELC